MINLQSYRLRKGQKCYLFILVDEQHNAWIHQYMKQQQSEATTQLINIIEQKQEQKQNTIQVFGVLISIFWNTLKTDERKILLSLIFKKEIILLDSALIQNEKEYQNLNYFILQLLILKDKKRKNNEGTQKQQYKYLRQQLTVKKQAEQYINEQQNLQQQSYLYLQETREQLITNNMNNQLKLLYLQSDQGF
ncbi:unnamed protein product [Paramecium octaurelia]|uniref:Uncharacterized protein n=1 Tax=Paramecium octaurelia TaxID=43137 RepID=A0A8S1TSB1_PAROT|nr:unnamed protein product [Paramecium octaurelia]